MGRAVAIIVQDEFLETEFLRDWLEALGFIVAGQASNLALAWKLARETEFDVAILDTRFGDEDAGELAAYIERRGKPFGFVTAVPADLDGTRFEGRPVAAKPCTIDQIADLMRRLT